MSIKQEKQFAENSFLVEKIAKKYSKYTNNGILELNDLIQAGNIGLLNAIKNKDKNKSKNNNFNAYARLYIEGEIKKELDIENGKGSLKRDKVKEISKFKRIKDYIIIEGKNLKKNEKIDEKTLKKVAKKMKISLKRTKELERLSGFSIVSLDESMSFNDTNFNPCDIIPDEKQQKKEQIERMFNDYNRTLEIISKIRTEHLKKLKKIWSSYRNKPSFGLSADGEVIEFKGISIEDKILECKRQMEIVEERIKFIKEEKKIRGKIRKKISTELFYDLMAYYDTKKD